MSAEFGRHVDCDCYTLEFVMKVIFEGASDAQVNWGGNDDPRKVLSIGAEYDVEHQEVHSWHTKIKLRNIDSWFNDASFRYV